MQVLLLWVWLTFACQMLDIDPELVEQTEHPPCCQQVGLVGSACGQSGLQTGQLGYGFSPYVVVKGLGTASEQICQFVVVLCK